MSINLDIWKHQISLPPFLPPAPRTRLQALSSLIKRAQRIVAGEIARQQMYHTIHMSAHLAVLSRS